MLILAMLKQIPFSFSSYTLPPPSVGHMPKPARKGSALGLHLTTMKHREHNGRTHWLGGWPNAMTLPKNNTNTGQRTERSGTVGK